MNFGGQDVKEVRELKYISPGVHEVTIKSVTGEVNKNGNPLIMFTMYLKDGSADDTTDFRFYLSDKAQTVSYSKIRHIFTKCVPDSEYLGAVASDVIGLGEAYDNIDIHALNLFRHDDINKELQELRNEIGIKYNIKEINTNINSILI